MPWAVGLANLKHKPLIGLQTANIACVLNNICGPRKQVIDHIFKLAGVAEAGPGKAREGRVLLIASAGSWHPTTLWPVWDYPDRPGFFKPGLKRSVYIPSSAGNEGDECGCCGSVQPIVGTCAHAC